MRYGWIGIDEAIEISDCTDTTLREYARIGMVGSTIIKGRRYFRAEDLASLDERYPRGESGRRRLPTPTRKTADRCIQMRERIDGKTTYYVTVYVAKEARRRSFRSLDAARRWRDKQYEMKESEPVTKTPSENDPKRSFFRRLLDRLATTTTTEEATN